MIRGYDLRNRQAILLRALLDYGVFAGASVSNSALDEQSRVTPSA